MNIKETLTEKDLQYIFSCIEDVELKDFIKALMKTRALRKEFVKEVNEEEIKKYEKDKQLRCKECDGLIVCNALTY